MVPQLKWEILSKSDSSVYCEWVPGDHRAIVFLHGFPDDRTVWDPAIRQVMFSQSTFVRFDLPGFGKAATPHTDASMTLHDIAQHIADTLALLPNESITLVGHDWGASVVWLLSEILGSRVRKIVIANGTHPHLYSEMLQSDAQLGAIFKYFAAFTREDAASKLHENNLERLRAFRPTVSVAGCLPHDGFTRLWSDRARLQAALGIYRANYESIVTNKFAPYRVKCPVSVIWGSSDHSMIRELGNQCVKYTSGSFNFIEIGGSHWALAECPIAIAIAKAVLDGSRTNSSDQHA